MKKLRFSIIALIVIAALIFISARAMGLYFSPEKVLEAREAALHYGPSDEILYKYTGPNGRGIIIAKCGDEGLSVIKTERIAGFLFRADGSSDGGVQGYCPCQKQISVWYDSDLDLVYGLSYGEPGEELIVKIGAWNGEQYSDTITSDSDGQYHTSVGEWVEELYSQKVATDEKGFFCINDISESLLKDQSDSRDEYYIYAESVLPVEDTDIRFDSNMPRGLVVGRSELDKLIPYDDEFMSEEDVQPSANIGSSVLNRINAGIKRYTGIDFFACEGGTDGETLCLYYDRHPWDDSDLVLTFEKDGGRFVPVASDENMDTAAISWLRMNYGKRYDVNTVSSQKREITEKDGKKQYRTVLSSYLRLRSNGVSGEMNVEVVVEADLNDPAAPWKMYYVSDTYGPDGAWELRDISELTVASYDVENGVYIINGYDAGHMEYVPANQAISNNSTDWTYVGELYFADPYFLGDYFRGKTAEGGATWADKNKESISFWFTIDAGGGGAVAGPTVSATINLKDNEIVESNFSGFETSPFTDEELINIGHRLADIIESVEGIM